QDDRGAAIRLTDSAGENLPQRSPLEGGPEAVQKIREWRLRRRLQQHQICHASPTRAFARRRESASRTKERTNRERERTPGTGRPAPVLRSVGTSRSSGTSRSRNRLARRDACILRASADRT